MSRLQNFPELSSLVDEISTITEDVIHTSKILYQLFDGMMLKSCSATTQS